MKKEIISKMFYVIAIILFCAYLITKYSEYMFFGGLSLIIASVIVIMDKKK